MGTPAKTRMIDTISAALGDGGDEYAERIFDALRDDGRIAWNEYETRFEMSEGVDVFAEAAKLSSK